MVKTSFPQKILITARFDGSVGDVINWKNLFNRLDWLFSTFSGAVFLSILLFPSDDNSCIKKGFIVKVQLAPQNVFSKTKSSNIVLVTYVKKIIVTDKISVFLWLIKVTSLMTHYRAFVRSGFHAVETICRLICIWPGRKRREEKKWINCMELYAAWYLFADWQCCYNWKQCRHQAWFQPLIPSYIHIVHMK